jgi:hypothetical protein
MRSGCSWDRQLFVTPAKAGAQRLGANHNIPAICYFACRAFRPPSEGESLFSCVAKRKVTKREGHPVWRLLGMKVQQVREVQPGF